MMETTKQRPLTDQELAAIIQIVEDAPNTDQALRRAMDATYNTLLAPFGESMADYTPYRRLKQGDFAIPAHQSFTIGGALMAKADNLIEAFVTFMDWAEHAPCRLTELRA